MKRKISIGVGLAGCLALAAVLTVTWTSAEEPPKGRKVFTNSVIPLPATGAAPHGLVVNAAVRDHSKDKMDIVFFLPGPKEAKEKLEARVLKGEVVTPEELAKSYSPKPEDVTRLTKWVKDEGMEVKQTSPDKTSIYVRATVGQLEKSLQVKMVRVTVNGQTFNAAQNAPSLPEDVGQGVHAILGSQPFRQFTKKGRVRRPVSPSPATSTSTETLPPFLVKDLLKAYNADALDVTGKGQTIAILIDTLPKADDTAEFWKKNGLPVVATRVEEVKVQDVPMPPVEGEESMDVQWSSGVAKGAKVRVYACGSLDFVALDLGLDKIIADAMQDPGLRQVSISLGLGEQFLSPDGTLDGELAIEHDKFLRLAALGVNVFVSSGDAGSNPDISGHSSTGPQQAEWMASSPFVVGVGGTSLFLDGTGKVTSELAWAGSGGGISKAFARPGYQKGKGVPDGDRRLVPDVSLVADPDTGAFVRLNGNDVAFGGTSLSAPVWAGFCALMNESRTKAGKTTLPFLNPLLYPLLGGDCFRDITERSNGAFKAGPGYDMVTGLGVPNVKNLILKFSN